MLVPGKMLTGRVLAVNSVGEGNYSSPAQARVMGFPSPIRSPASLEEEDRILFSWLAPADTGFGDSNATILSYDVYLSECFDFSTAIAECRTKSVPVDPAQSCQAGVGADPANCTFEIGRAHV